MADQNNNTTADNPDTNAQTEPTYQRRRHRRKKHKGHHRNPLTSIRKHVMLRKRHYNETLKKYDSYLTKRDTALERLVKMASKLGKYQSRRNHMFSTIVGGDPREKVKEALALKLKSQTKSEQHLKHRFEKQLKHVKTLHDLAQNSNLRVSESIAELERACVVLTAGGFANVHNLEELGVELKRSRSYKR